MFVFVISSNQSTTCSYVPFADRRLYKRRRKHKHLTCLSWRLRGGERGKGREDGEREERGRERERGEAGEGREGFFQYILYTFIYFHTPLYTFIYLHIPPNTFKYLYIPSYTPIYPNIFNSSKMKINIRHKNCHKSGLRASPRVRIWPVASYHVPRGLGTPKGAQN